ncbi:DUF3109 family protein [Flavobacterium sp. PL02]|nr:DUF3109 family protein [Flavobacterium sp. PL02]MEA9415073.1 DUF3109 family protein [Flavobacterium sp. PL02]
MESNKPIILGIVSWKKAVSCHLYPIRVKDFTKFAVVNYDKWDI